MKRIVAAAGQAGSWIALAPSLVPRTWWMTAINVTVNAFGAQKLAESLDRALGRLPHPWPPEGRRATVSDTFEAPTGLSEAGRRRWKRDTVLFVLAAGGSVLALRHSMDRQQEVTRLTGGPDSDPALKQFLGYLAGLGGWFALDSLTSLSSYTRHVVERRVKKVLPFVPSVVISAGALALWWNSYRYVLTEVLRSLDARAVVSDFARVPGDAAPTEPERTGSRTSREPFSTLGYHGRGFVSAGPRADRIAAVRASLARRGLLPGPLPTTAPEAPWTGPKNITPDTTPSPGPTGSEHGSAGPARTPIRVFIGRLAHPTLEDAAEAAVAELARAGAFERSALLLVTNTGSGWIPQWTVEAVEYLTAGDCASAAVQYSFAGSWLNFLIGRQQAVDSSRLLHRAVLRHLAGLPEDARPRLYATGESLGALGGNGAFFDLHHMRRTLDGAVWTGTPRATPLVGRLIDRRRPGTPEIRPMIGRGDMARFVTRPEDLHHDSFGEPYPAWTGAPIVYAQHPSDPIVWWEPKVVWERPDWMVEPRGEDVSAHMRWTPWATFWQLSSDMPRSVKLPGGHGHNYHAEVVHYWNEVLGTGLDPRACTALGDAIATDLGPATGSLPLTDPGPWQTGAREGHRRTPMRGLLRGIRDLARKILQGSPGENVV
ncbi:alpha/beta-hydrolase family protein [Brevibacterium litoralis]|uniref:alpha/beta-hydrolase family protein n=1 Tax=Brevibacterium litoralis TaxID=3138935 RepID=UPI0032ED530B